MRDDLSPTARALLTLEAIQNNPGITAQRLGDRLGVSERAARRYVGILREADVPIESTTGPHGGYQVGRGLRLPPLMLTAAEAMGLAMAVVEGHPGAADPADLVGAALAKILRVLPRRVAEPVRETASERSGRASPVRQELVADLLAACSGARRVRIGYRARETEREMEVDPWSVVLRHSRWYLLAWSHTRDAFRVFRVDRITAVAPTAHTFTPPADLDALRTLEDHLSRTWTHPVEVVIDAPPAEVSRWIPRSLGTLLEDGPDRSRLRATTDNPHWYARQLAALPMTFDVVAGPQLRAAVAALGERLAKAALDVDQAATPVRRGEGGSGVVVPACR
ncbi:WYL domain-containing protein [Asanoa sp. NPDC049573]|uniref:helix-turn-helix transcriptional regulator n=1 Tax=Asanoa sp. NPDC049573 TaxID=3155396 RepID=UPI003442163F